MGSLEKGKDLPKYYNDVKRTQLLKVLSLWFLWKFIF